jgi:hydroxymethylpyrimidine/phosphomethylpyrimidine kinase
MNRRPAVLVIAGSDSSGGAGLQRDLAVLHAVGVAHASAITAITAQTDDAVRAIHHVPPAIIADQIAAAFDCRDIRAIKIGMLGTKATVTAVAASLKARRDIPIVLDPVLVSSSGRALLDLEGLRAMRDLLFPMATLVTPNLPEMATLCGTTAAASEAEMAAQAQKLLELGPRAVLAKGGHGDGEEALDLLVTRDAGVLRLSVPRLNASMRGTGCALSTAIAAGLASGKSLRESCKSAKEHVQALMMELNEPLNAAPTTTAPIVLGEVHLYEIAGSPVAVDDH